MFNPQNPEDLRAMLLHMAAASVGVPEGRQRVAKWLRSALALIDDDVSSPTLGLTPAQAHALDEIAESLGMAAEHAAYLAKQAARLTADPPGSARVRRP